MYYSILAGVQLIQNGVTIIENHSFLRFHDVGTGDNALLCVSDNPECCTEANANWFLPGSTTPLTGSSYPYFVSRSTTAPRNVALMRGGFVYDHDGLYHCEIIDTDGTTRMLYFWLDYGSQGRY